jgi:two-component system chemotaxis response regulator CheY
MPASEDAVPGELEYKSLRILIAGGREPSARLLRTSLNLAGVTQVAVATSAKDALKLLKDQIFNAVFVDETIGDIDKVKFVVAARREPGVLEPLIPIFLICNAVRLRELTKARDGGVTDILARPISAATLMRKLSKALLQPRPFIKAESFFGPDRRGKERPPHSGEDRRTRKARKVRVDKPASESTEVVL